MVNILQSIAIFDIITFHLLTIYSIKTFTLRNSEIVFPVADLSYKKLNKFINKSNNELQRWKLSIIDYFVISSITNDGIYKMT